MHREMRISCFWTYFSLDIDFPAMKFHRVSESPKMHLRDGKSRIIDHTIVRISSTRVQNSSPSLEAWNKYRRILRLSSQFSFRSNSISCSVLSHSTRRWCQIPGIFRRELRVVLLEQAVVRKRFLKYSENPVYYAASQDRGKAFLWDSK